MSESIIRLSAFFGILFIMACWQALAPRRPLRFGYQRWPANLGIVLLDALLVRLLIPTGAVGAAVWAGQANFGVMHWLNVPHAVAVAVAVIVLDGIIYAQHVLFHAVPMLWRLHMVHHADQDIDVTTGLRFHPVEILLSMLIKILVVALLGVPVLAVILFEIILNGMAMFNHANVRLPLRLDAILRFVLVTPDMHRVHHSIIRSETNSNFGFNLSIWDRIFGTYQAQPGDGHDGMTIGLSQYQSEQSGSLGWMLVLPFTGRPGGYPIFRRESDS
ncbi:MAG: sterol desaturase family protein [Mariprofundaceae bacterium]|nr:sterol desaturase family protein [Mariprofundaceae bacterium]